MTTGMVACGSKKEEGDYAKQSNRSYDYVSDEAPAEEYAPTANVSGNQQQKQDIASAPLPEVVSPKLIRTADLRFQVKDIQLSGENIEKLAVAYKAYVSNASLNSTNYESNNTMTIRVPSENFDVLLKAISKESIFMERRNVSTQDVTEEFVDITTRLKTKKEVEARYIEILRTKAKTVKEILEAEEQIRQIREEIESREGRLKYLQNQVSYSTITVQIFEQIEYRESPQELTETFGSKASSGFSQGWQAIQNLVIGLITFWPLLLSGAIVFFLIRKKIRSNKKTKI